MVAVGVVNVACAVGTVALARRRGETALMLAVGAAIPLMLASLPAEAASDVWNPAAPLLPFVALLFVCWSLACGEYRLLPVAAVLASFVVQCHFTFVAPVAGALAVGLFGLVRSRSDIGRGWLVAALAVALVCWSAPLVEQAVHRPGNFVVLVRAAGADEATLGAAAGARGVARAIGVPPWWLRSERDALGRVYDLSTVPGPLAIATGALMLAALALLAAAWWRRERWDLAAASLMGLTLCAALALTVASAPRAAFQTSGYALWWASPAGMWVWLVVGFGAVSLMAPRRAVARVRSAPATAAGVAVVALSGGLVALLADRSPEPHDQVRLVTEGLTERTPLGGVVGVAGHVVAGDAAARARLPGRRDIRPAPSRSRGVRPAVRQGAGLEISRPQASRETARMYVDRPPPPGPR